MILTLCRLCVCWLYACQLTLCKLTFCILNVTNLLTVYVLTIPSRLKPLCACLVHLRKRPAQLSHVVCVFNDKITMSGPRLYKPIDALRDSFWAETSQTNYQTSAHRVYGNRLCTS